MWIHVFLLTKEWQKSHGKPHNCLPWGECPWICFCRSPIGWKDEDPIYSIDDPGNR